MSEAALSGVFRFLPPGVRDAVCALARSRVNFYSRLSELRLRAGRYASLTVGGENLPLPVLLSAEELSSVFVGLCRGSVYAFRDSLSEGYIDLGGGVRVGVAGRALLEDGRVRGVCDVTSLSFRIPNTVRGAGNEAYRAFLDAGGHRGLLIYSPPGVGKTTLLRDLCRLLSTGEHPRRVAIVDSRGELGGEDYGRDALVDILSGYPKAAAIEQAVRTLSPEVIAVDELGSRRETEAILEVAASGVPLVATVHGAQLSEVLSRPAIRILAAVGTFGTALGLRREGDRVVCHREELPTKNS